MTNVVVALLLAIAVPPATPSHVYDGAGLLSADALARVDQGIVNVRNRINANMALVTFAAIDEEPQAIALRTAQQWELGDRSAVVLISTSPKKIFIQLGRGFGPNLSGAMTSIASTVMAPRLKAGDNAGAIIEGFRAITTQVEKVTTAPQQRPAPASPQTRTIAVSKTENDEEAWLIFFLVITAIFIAGVLLVLYLMRRSDRRWLERNPGYYDHPSQPSPIYSSSATSTPRPYIQSSYSPPAYTPPPAPVVVNSGNGDFLTGMMVANAMNSNHDHHHHREPDVVREVVRERPVYTPPAEESKSSSGGSDWGSLFDSSSSSSGGSSSSSGGSDWGSSDSGSSFDSGSSSGGSDW